MLPASAKVEAYLETIYNMDMEGEVIIGARLAEKFRVKAPTVTEMLKRLEKADYVEVDAQHTIHLTQAGLTLAEAILRRHRLTERFLTDMLGMQWHEVHQEASRLEHYISGAVEERVLAALGHPVTCPHGNPIPGAVKDARGYLTRHSASRLPTTNGKSMRILCVSEVVEDEEEIVQALHERGLTPGTPVRWQGATGEECTVLRGEYTLVMPYRLANALWVVPAKDREPSRAAAARP